MNTYMWHQDSLPFTPSVLYTYDKNVPIIRHSATIFPDKMFLSPSPWVKGKERSSEEYGSDGVMLNKLGLWLCGSHFGSKGRHFISYTL